MINHSIPDKVKQEILKIEPDADVILYGSRARNDFREYSDWDFLILVDGIVNTIRTDKLRSILYDIELNTGEIINSIIRNKVEWNGPRYQSAPLHLNIEHEGVKI
jgi:predicted nucleotidyltransferase